MANTAIALCVPVAAHTQQPAESADLAITSFTASHTSVAKNKATQVTYYLAAKNNGPHAVEEAVLDLLPGDLDASDAHTVVSVNSDAAAECLPGESLPTDCRMPLPAGRSFSMVVTADVRYRGTGKVEVAASVSDEFTPDPNTSNDERRLSLGVGGSAAGDGGGDSGLFDLAPTIAGMAKPGRSPIAFSLTRPARVRFTVSKRVTGRRKGRRCVPGRRRGKRCKTYRALGSFAVSGATGPRSVTLPKRVRGRRLRPGGRYLLTVQARDVVGLRSPVYTRKFKVRKN